MSKDDADLLAWVLANLDRVRIESLGEWFDERAVVEMLPNTLIRGNDFASCSAVFSGLHLNTEDEERCVFDEFVFFDRVLGEVWSPASVSTGEVSGGE